MISTTINNYYQQAAADEIKDTSVLHFKNKLCF